MHGLEDLIRQGALHAWLFLPAAVLLGILHGLEPGHSKTMMAAFLIAIRGTVFQAVLLGLAAAFSHTLIIWVLAAAALHYGSHWDAATTEPYFQLASAALIVGLAAWMAWRTRRDLHAEAAHAHAHAHGHAHSHDHAHGEFADAHEQAHAADLEHRFAGKTVTTGQIVLFGLTGGLLPCPAAFTILLVCLQVKRFSLGLAMVLAFSVGLAITLVTVGVLAAWSVRHAEKKFAGLGAVARRLPYLSSGLLILMGLYIGLQGWLHLAGHP
jgi:nickel/cobalt exporter